MTTFRSTLRSDPMLSARDLVQLARDQDTKRTHRTMAMPPDVRLQRFEALQATAMQVLQSNPEAITAFHRRCRSRRRQAQVQALLEEIQASSPKHE